MPRASATMSAWPLAHDVLGLVRFGDQAHGHGRQAGLTRIASAKPTWYFGPSGIFCCGDTPPLDTWMKLQPSALQFLGQHHALRQVPAAVDPVGGRDAHAQRVRRRHRCAHGV
jgi:hypothetical protein